MKIMLITDAWKPQTNGVVTTLEQVVRGCERFGHEVVVVEPGSFLTVPMPGYPQIRMAISPFTVGRRIRAERPDAIHLATEGPLGLAARRYLVRAAIPFTTSLHTKFPEYVHARTGAPVRWGYAFLRWFHRPARSTLVTTQRQRDELAAWGLRHLSVWGRGVDTESFRPPEQRQPGTPPLLAYVGRVATEKNLAAFLNLTVPGRKIVVGDGPERAELQRLYPQVSFVGFSHGEALKDWYGRADVLVFPSRTDTFGLVMLEALACGTPVAAYPVTGPLDLIRDGVTGALDDDLDQAVERALRCDRASCRAFAEGQGWDQVVQRFVDDLVPVHRLQAASALI